MPMVWDTRRNRFVAVDSAPSTMTNGTASPPVNGANGRAPVPYNVSQRPIVQQQQQQPQQQRQNVPQRDPWQRETVKYTHLVGGAVLNAFGLHPVVEEMASVWRDEGFIDEA